MRRYLQAVGALSVVSLAALAMTSLSAQESTDTHTAAASRQDDQPIEQTINIETSDAVTKLPMRIRMLFTREMMAIEVSMNQLFSSTARGQWDSMERFANRIHQRFVMEQELTDEDRALIKETLPDDFLTRDKAFHENAEKLAAAAREKNVEKVNLYYSKLATACLSCHARYATQKFPTLVNAVEGGINQTNEPHPKDDH